MDCRVYAITGCTADTPALVEAVEKAAIGGITALQYRPKGMDDGVIIEQAQRLQEVLRPRNIPLIINDYVEVAKAIKAAGVHLGQRDIDPQRARDYLGIDAVIGMSVGSERERRSLPATVVNYVGCGPVYRTQTKMDVGVAIGVEAFCRLKDRIPIATVAIGGITVAGGRVLVAAGVDGLAVSMGLFSAPDITSRAREFLRLWA